MDSLNATLIIGLDGRAKGVTSNPLVSTPIRFGTRPSLDLDSTSSGASNAGTAFGIGRTRTLNPSASEELDLFSFSSVLNESSSSMTKARLFYVHHLPTSVASAIVCGNGSGNNFNPFSIGLTTTMTLTPGEGFIFWSATTAGMTISNTVKTYKVANSDGVNIASYEIGDLGSV